MLLRTDYI